MYGRSLPAICSLAQKGYGRGCLYSTSVTKEEFISARPPPTTSTPTGFVVGLYCDENDIFGNAMTFTADGKKYNDQVCGKLQSQLLKVLPPPGLGQVRMFFDLDDKYNAVAVVGMGNECLNYNPEEGIDEQKEVIRIASAAGCRALQDLNLQKIIVESFGHAESAAEGSFMGVWKYSDSGFNEDQKMAPKVELHGCGDTVGWGIGKQKALAQNLARQLTESPPNIMTPSTFALNAVDVLTKAGVNAEAKVKDWGKVRDFNALLAVASGSCQPPIFLEAYYEGCEPEIAPIVLIGQGITFDAGGLPVKNCTDLGRQRYDFAGAAAVVAALKAISSLRIPINVRGLIPLCENMPGSHAFKPGDIIRAQNGISILVQMTSDVGRLILADALSYSKCFMPKFIIDIGTLSQDTQEAMGSAASGVFTYSDPLFDLLRIASIHTGDRVWRFPLFDYYSNDIEECEKCDLLNVGTTPFGAACNAASFLQKFVPNGSDCVHMDINGVAYTSGNSYPYLRKGMSGRPTRTLIEFLAQLTCQAPSTCP